MSKAPHATVPLTLDFACEQCPEPVAPEAMGFVAVGNVACLY